MILPETDMDAALQKLEALRALLAAEPMTLGSQKEQVQITISAGLACFPDDSAAAAGLFAVADERMFQAKREGRNRVIAGSNAVING